MGANEGHETWEKILRGQEQLGAGCDMETIQESAWRQLMQAAASLNTLCALQVLGTRTYISTGCCFFIVGQKNCSGNRDCQALFPALTGEYVMLFFF